MEEHKCLLYGSQSGKQRLVNIIASCPDPPHMRLGEHAELEAESSKQHAVYRFSVTVYHVEVANLPHQIFQRKYSLQNSLVLAI